MRQPRRRGWGRAWRASAALLAAACSGELTGLPGRDGGGDGPEPDADPCPPIADRPGVCQARGLYDGPIEVELRPPDGAEILYTLDGSIPDATTGQLYDGPISIAPPEDRGVVVLRARAGDGPVVTHSYVFPERVLDQAAAPAGFPDTWGNGQTRAADYAMDARVLGDRAAAAAGLAALPTVSLTLAPDDLFGVERGIYMNPSLEGVEWERPAVLEMVGDGLSLEVPCGVRVQGGSSTLNWKSPKLSLRVLFKGEYGAPELRAPIFGGDGATASFDTLVLDAHLNYTWIHPEVAQRQRADYLRDRFASDLALALGSLAPRGRFVHLYLNGLYWGLYELHERPDEHFAAAYLGGAAAGYDVLKHTGATVVNGDDQAWRAMFDLARAGLADEARYAEIQTYLEVDDFINYMLVNLWAGNDDWPHHNWYATRQRTPEGRFRFHSWDAEHVLTNVAIDRTGVESPDTPGELFQALRQNADFRARLAARAGELLAPGGALAPPRPAELYRARADEIRPAVLLESARWGDSQSPEAPHGLAEWDAEQAWLLDQYFPARSDIVAGQLPPP